MCSFSPILPCDTVVEGCGGIIKKGGKNGKCVYVWRLLQDGIGVVMNGNESGLEGVEMNVKLQTYNTMEDGLEMSVKECV